jgi:nicotinate-nucleotide pyrophosphorylase (carboxylating)
VHLFDGDALDQLIRLALTEDIGAGDATTESIVAADATGAAVAIAKGELIVCGVDVAARVFELLDARVKFTPRAKDGDALSPGDVAFELAGSLRTLLTGERAALNFVQRLSGIATLTRRCVRALEGSKTRLLDTRKTAPGFRALEKRAVRAGGGHGHRTNLADGVLIKDNHIAAAGSITQAVTRARSYVHPLLRIEVEVKNLTEVEEALRAGAGMLLLDNMSDAQLTEAVRVVNGRVPTEASGNISLDRLPAICRTGVDFVSMGALTHSAPAADIALAITNVRR